MDDRKAWPHLIDRAGLTAVMVPAERGSAMMQWYRAEVRVPRNAADVHLTNLHVKWSKMHTAPQVASESGTWRRVWSMHLA